MILRSFHATYVGVDGDVGRHDYRIPPVPPAAFHPRHRVEQRRRAPVARVNRGNPLPLSARNRAQIPSTIFFGVRGYKQYPIDTTILRSNVILENARRLLPAPKTKRYTCNLN